MVANPFGDLSVRISARTQDFTRGVRSAKESLGDLSSQSATTSGALEILSQSADEAGDQVSQLGRRTNSTNRSLKALTASAAGAAGAFTGLASVTNTLTLSFSSLSNTPLLFILPALTAAATALLSVLFPLAAAAGVIAAAFGGLFGALAVGTLAAAATHTKTLTNAFNEMKKEVLAALEPLADAFLPLLLSIMDRIPRVVGEIVEMAGGFKEFRDAVWGVADAVFDVIPEFAAVMFEFGRMALPILRDFFKTVQGNVRPAMQAMLRVTRRITPPLVRLGRAFVNATPELTKLGVVVLNTLVPAFTSFIKLVEDVIQIGEGATGLVDFLNTLVTKAVKWVKGPGAALLTKVGDAVFSTVMGALAGGNNGGGGGGGVVSTLGTTILNTLDTLSAWLSNTAIPALSDIATDIFGRLAIALSNISDKDIQTAVDNVLSVVASVFDGVTSALSSDEGGELSKQLGRIAAEVMATFADKLVSYVSSEAFQEDLGQLAGALENALRESMRGVDVGLGKFNLKVGGRSFKIPLGFGSNLPTPNEVNGGGGGPASVTNSAMAARVVDPRSQGARQITQGEAQRLMENTNFTVKVNVEGDTDVIKNAAGKVVARNNRQQGRDAEASRTGFRQ